MFLCTARRPHDCVWDVLKDLWNALLIMKTTQSTYKLFLGRTHENITILKAKDGLQLFPASIHIGDGKINFGNDGNHIQMLLCWEEEGNKKKIHSLLQCDNWQGFGPERLERRPQEAVRLGRQIRNDRLRNWNQHDLKSRRKRRRIPGVSIKLYK